jgi:hypothetical protein
MEGERSGVEGGSPNVKGVGSSCKRVRGKRRGEGGGGGGEGGSPPNVKGWGSSCQRGRGYRKKEEEP